MSHSAAPATLTPAGPRQWAALGILTLAVVLLAIDGTVLALAVPALTEDLDPSAAQILWIGDIYSFVLAGLLITMGNVADKIGRKKLLLIGSAIFGISSMVAAFAPTPEMLIAARALLGASGATLMPSTLSIIRNIFQVPQQRTLAIAIWTAGATAGAAIGPLVGGALLEHFWWGSVFLINVPVMFVLVLGGIVLLPESRNPKAGRIDLRSALLSIVAIVPVVYAVKQLVGQGWSWSVPITAIIGLVAGVLFIRRQIQLPQPLVDLSLFKIPAFSGAIMADTIAIFAFSGLLFFFSQYLQLVRGFSPLEAGMAELPITLSSIAVIVVIGLIVKALGRGPAIGLGLLAGAVGLAGMAIAEGLPTFLWLAVALAIIGLGVGVAATLSVDAVVEAAPAERAGAAASLAETGYELGVALGIAILGSLQTLLYRVLVHPPAGLAASQVDSLEDSLASASAHLAHDPQAASALEQAREAFTTAMQWTSVVAAILTAIAGVIAWRLIPPVGRRDLLPAETGQGAEHD